LLFLLNNNYFNFFLGTGNIGHVYCNLFGLAGVVVCSENYPTRVAFGLIDKALDLFSKRVEKEIWMSCSKPVDSPWLKDMFNLFKNPAEADSLVRVQKELDETKVVLHKTIESLLDRGEKLDDLVSKSNELGVLSKTFLKDTKKTNSCCVIQ
jgi:synaptobrevin family protein YKT6